MARPLGIHRRHRQNSSPYFDFRRASRVGDFHQLIEVLTLSTCSHYCSVGLALANRILGDPSTWNCSLAFIVAAG